MGGRGAASGYSVDKKGNRKHKYGTEYTTLLKVGNIKFVKNNMQSSAKAPLETMTKGRVYVTINNQNKPSFISYYDTKGKRTKTIDLIRPHNGKSPHVHHGYEHSEQGIGLSVKELNMVKRVIDIWENR